MSPFSHIHRRFYAIYSLIHIALPDFSQMNLVWKYSDKTDIIKCVYLESVKSFIQSKQNVMPFSIWCEFTFQERNMKLEKQEY